MVCRRDLYADVKSAFHAMNETYTGIFYVKTASTIGAEGSPAVWRHESTGQRPSRTGTQCSTFFEWKSVYFDYSAKLSASAQMMKVKV